jgi:hypothetical protein
MKIVCNGKRIAVAASAELITALGLTDLAKSYTDDGYRLLPMRAPRGLRQHGLSIRLVWQKQSDDVVLTIRHTIRLTQPRSV